MTVKGLAIRYLIVSFILIWVCIAAAPAANTLQAAHDPPFIMIGTTGPHGSMIPNGTMYVGVGDDRTYTMFPDPGYRVKDVIVDGQSVGAVTSYRFSGICADHTIHAEFERAPGKSYTIVATSGPHGYIAPNGSVVVPEGGMASFIIAPDNGFRIADVLVDGQSVGKQSSYSFTNIQQDHTIYASFEPVPVITYKITALSGPNGHVSPSGTTVVQAGGNAAFTILPNNGYQIADVTVDGQSVGKKANYTFVNVQSDHVLYAAFEAVPVKTYKITAIAGPNGKISPQGTITVQPGANVVFTITPDAGYQIADTTVDGLSIGKQSSYTFSNVQADHVIYAAFEPVPVKTYKITAMAGPNGLISPSGTVTVQAGSNASFIISPSSGYRILDVTVDGTSVGTPGTYLFTNIQSDHVIYAAFEPVPVKTYKVTAISGPNGKIIPGGTITVQAGSNATFVASPDSGYQIADITVDGTSVGKPVTYTFVNIQSDHVIYAAFEPVPVKNYRITAINGPNGSIIPNGTITVPAGGNATFSIIPSSGYNIAEVTVDGQSVGKPTTYSFTGVQTDHVIYAAFEPIPVTTYRIMAAAGSNGRITPNGTITVQAGSDATFTITPDGGFRIADVSVDGRSVGKPSTYAFTDVRSDHVIYAAFEPIPVITFKIVSVAGPNGKLDPSGTITVAAGSNATFAATANTGYRIGEVLADGKSVGNVSSYTFTNIQADHTITASFVPVEYIITASAGPNGRIDPSGDVVVVSGASSTFIITPEQHFRVRDVLVDGQSVGPVTNYTFSSVNANHTIRAEFVAVEYVVNATAGPNGKIDPSGEVKVRSGSNATFAITPDATYAIRDVLVDGRSVGALSSYTFSSVNANHTIRAEFVAVEYVVNATAGPNGKIDPSGEVKVRSGSNATFAITPDATYAIRDVLVDGRSVGALSSYTFSSVNANHTIRAEFTPSVYVINSTAGPNGVINPAGLVNVNAGTNATFVITPNTGYQVADLVVDGSSIGKFTSYTFGAVDRNHTITALFEPVLFTITARSEGGGTITTPGMVNGTVTVKYGDQVCFNVTPDDCYLVGAVTLDGAAFLPPYCISNTTADHSVVARFEKQKFTVSTISGPGGSISPVNMTVNCGDCVNVTVTPDQGNYIGMVSVNGVPFPLPKPATSPVIVPICPVKSNTTVNATFIFPPRVDFTGEAVTSCKAAADVTGEHVTINPGMQVRFTDLSTGGQSLRWDFGNGQISTEKNPVVTYQSTGTYTVTLTVFNEAEPAGVTKTRTNYIIVTKLPVPGIIAEPDGGRAGPEGLTIRFTGCIESNYGIRSDPFYSWNFGDGTPGVIGRTATHTYRYPGNYTVTYLVKNIYGGETATKVIRIT